MKKHSSQQIRVGIFVTIGLVLGMIAIFLLSDIEKITQKQYTLYAQFEDSSGLRIGAPIFLAGIKIGQVEEIRFPEKLEETKVRVKLEISKEFQERIRQDSTATIVTQGLLGDKSMFITVGTAKFAAIPNDGEIKVGSAPSIEAFAAKAQQALDNVDKLTKNVDGIITDIKTKQGMIYSLIYDPEGKKIIADLATVTNAAIDVVNAIQNRKGLVHAIIYDDSTRNLVDNADKLLKDARGLTADFKNISAKVQRGEGTIGAFLNDPTVYNDLMTLLGNANRSKLLRTVIRATLSGKEKSTIGQ